MDNKKKLGMVLILLAVVIAAFALYIHFHPSDKNVEKPLKGKQETVVKTPDEEERSELVDFEIRNLPESYLQTLELTEPELAEMLKEWTQNNQEYTGAIGVEFFDYFEEDPMEDKYSFMMQTIVGEEAYAEEAQILMLDYYKGKRDYNIHP